MLLIGSIVSLTLLANTHGSPPWLDMELAGYTLADDQTHHPTVVHDVKSGFFLIRQIECDGGMITLELTRDHHDLPADMDEFASWEGLGGKKLPLEKPLPNLKTSKGVSIGDSPANLKQSLGKPSKIEPSGERDQYLNYVYECTLGKGDGRVGYTETYTFKKSKLIQIVFFRDTGA